LKKDFLGALPSNAVMTNDITEETRSDYSMIIIVEQLSKKIVHLLIKAPN